MKGPHIVIDNEGHVAKGDAVVNCYAHTIVVKSDGSIVAYDADGGLLLNDGTMPHQEARVLLRAAIKHLVSLL